MQTTRAQATTKRASERELCQLVEDIAYARALIRTAPEELGEHDRPLRRALAGALAALADTEETRRAIAEAALERAWSRVAAEIADEPEGDEPGPVASAA